MQNPTFDPVLKTAKSAEYLSRSVPSFKRIAANDPTLKAAQVVIGEGGQLAYRLSGLNAYLAKCETRAATTPRAAPKYDPAEAGRKGAAVRRARAAARKAAAATAASAP